MARKHGEFEYVAFIADLVGIKAQEKSWGREEGMETTADLLSLSGCGDICDDFIRANDNL